ncbi:hypothetical protein A2U01_0075111, partial [Trifolium medium]|nr:hypothetical protein [Trifolium medium]
MSGRCIRSCAGADNGRWAADCGSHCFLVVGALFYVWLIFFPFLPPLLRVLVQVFIT